MAIGDVHRLTWVYFDNGTGKNLTHGVHVELVTALPFPWASIQPVMKDFWDTAGPSGGGAYKVRCAVSVVFVKIKAQKVFPLPVGVPQELDITPTIPGTAVGDSFAATATPVASLRTAFAGRRNRGRMFLPPVAETMAAGGGLSAGVAQNIAKQVEDLRSALSGLADIEPVIFSEVANTTETMLSVKVDNRIRVQRRRQLRTPNYSTP